MESCHIIFDRLQEHIHCELYYISQKVNHNCAIRSTLMIQHSSMTRHSLTISINANFEVTFVSVDAQSTPRALNPRNEVNRQTTSSITLHPIPHPRSILRRILYSYFRKPINRRI